MGWLELTLWGLFGGFAMDALDLVTAVRRHHRWPWQDEDGKAEPGPLPYGIAVVLRVVVGGGVACAAARTHGLEVSPWWALGLGAAAPVVLEKLVVLVPLVTRTAAEALASQATQEPEAQPTASAAQKGQAASPAGSDEVGPLAESGNASIVPQQEGTTERAQGRN